MSTTLLKIDMDMDMEVDWQPDPTETKFENDDNTKNELVWKDSKHTINEIIMLKKGSKMELTFKAIQSILVSICLLSYINIQFTNDYSKSIRIYVMNVYIVVLIVSLIRIFTLFFRCELSQIKLVMTIVNSIMAVLTGSIIGITTYTVIFDSEKYSPKVLITVQAVFCLITPFVYLIDVAYNVNNLSSLTF